MRTTVLATSRPSPATIRLVPLMPSLLKPVSQPPFLHIFSSSFLTSLFWAWFSLGKTRGNGVVVPQGHVIFHEFQVRHAKLFGHINHSFSLSQIT